jgi:hypothetical protein
MPLLDIAFLKNVGSGWITLVCALPALAFCVYVMWDDHRQAKQQERHGGGHAAH